MKPDISISATVRKDITEGPQNKVDLPGIKEQDIYINMFFS